MASSLSASPRRDERWVTERDRTNGGCGGADVAVDDGEEEGVARCVGMFGRDALGLIGLDEAGGKGDVGEREEYCEHGEWVESFSGRRNCSSKAVSRMTESGSGRGARRRASHAPPSDLSFARCSSPCMCGDRERCDACGSVFILGADGDVCGSDDG